MDPTDIEMFYLRVGSDIAAMRRRAQLTQHDLARLVNLSRSSITNMESGVQRPALHILAVLCPALGVTLDELVAGSVEAVNAGAVMSDRVQALRVLHQTRLVQRQLLAAHGQLGDVVASLAQAEGK